MARFHRAKGKRSGFEQTVCSDLDRRGIPYQYEPDKLKYWRIVRGAKCSVCQNVTVTKGATYTPDLKFGNGTYCEIKGRFTAANRARMVDFKTSQLLVVVRILFQADNWTTTKKLQRYTTWATRHHFPCSVGTRVPLAWTK